MSIRIEHPQAIYHVTNQTIERQFLLVPDTEFTEMAATLLRRSIRIFGIELYAACIMVNHFHLVVRAPRRNLSRFMQYFTATLARRVNKLRGRQDRVFSRPYHSEIIADSGALERIVGYVLANPIRAGVVADGADYPGLSTYRQCVGLATHCELDITILPQWAASDDESRKRHYRELLAPIVEEYRGQDVLGGRKCTQLDWRARPKCPQKREKPPICHASTLGLWHAYAEFRKRVIDAFRRASRLWQKGNLDVKFPSGTTPPGRRTSVRRRDRFVLPPKFWILI